MLGRRGAIAIGRRALSSDLVVCTSVTSGTSAIVERASKVGVGERRGIALARHLSVALLVMARAQITIVGGAGRIGDGRASDHGTNGDKGDDREAHCGC